MAYADPKHVDASVRDDTDSNGIPASAENLHILHDGTEQGREVFLASFTADEDKKIMRKVDMRFLWLIGITYLIKNSESPNIPPPRNKSFTPNP